MMLKKTLLPYLSLFALCSALPTAATAAPIPVWLNVQPESYITLTAAAIGGTVTNEVTVGIEGSVHALMDWTMDSAIGPFATVLGIEEFDLFPEDFSLSLDLGQLGGLSATSSALHIGGSGPLAPFFMATGGPGLNPMSWFDLEGTTLSVDDGLLTYEGTGALAGFVPPGTFDFAADPLNGVLPPGSSVKVIEEHIIPGQKANVTLLMPFSFATTVLTTPTDVTVDISGWIVATGMKVVPEPASWLLIGLGMCSVMPMIRRRWQRRRSG